MATASALFWSLAILVPAHILAGVVFLVVLPSAAEFVAGQRSDRHSHLQHQEWGSSSS
jgi:hypothetical protein